MERKMPVPGSFYRHFRGNIYQIKDIATHSETGEKMVVYQAMYPPFGTWVRPLVMFLEKVDGKKYPDAKQRYRFEQIDMWVSTAEDNDTIRQEPEKGKKEKKSDVMTEQKEDSMPGAVSDENLKEILVNGQAEKLLSGRIPDQEIARRGFLSLLDAESFREKRQILAGLKPYLNEIHLSNIAVALDIVLEEGSAEEHYETILHCLETFEKYEGGRLRR